MPTFCAANRCTNNSNKGYSVFDFPSNKELRQKWIAALGKGSDWRPTFQRICEVHFNSVDIQLVAGRKQLCENAIPCHFCVCPYTKQTSELSIKLPKLQDCPSLSLEEEETLYKMCGYVLRKLQSSIKCKVCYNSLLHQRPVDHPKAGLLLVCEFVEAALVRVSDEVYQILHGAESIIMASENIMKDLGGSLKCTLESHIMKELSSFPLSTCHDQRQTLISRFLSMRLRQLLPCPKSNQNTAFASKSMGSRLLADAFNPRPR
ncbi:uncharacterized protein LOC143905797 isoform X2 [Temnothorax americanus]|uniref:uncharacterized protein LOC143905797 isoform X2 n=1 Tax=Temnothorax americanus TaxID=1964332 RepID=UPI0040677242